METENLVLTFRTNVREEARERGRNDAPPVADDENIGGGGDDRLSEGPPTQDKIEHDFWVPGAHDVCGKADFAFGSACKDRTRYVRYVPSNSGKKLVCGRGHNHKHKGTYFIPPSEFERGGGLEHAELPPELRPSEAKLTQARWKVSSAASKRLGNYKVCASCDIPEFKTYDTPDTGILLEWVSLHHNDLRDRIRDELARIPGTDMSDWYRNITSGLRGDIVNRASMSIISVDHGIAKKVGNEIWAELSSVARTLLQESLLFPLCRLCNLRKGATRVAMDALEILYIKYNYDGSVAHARADHTRWDAFQEILFIVYRESAG